MNDAAQQLANTMAARFLPQHAPGAILQRFTDCDTGRVYVSGLFRLHDEVGFPLPCAIDECRKRGEVPCLAQFKADAIRAGWTADRADRVIAEALADGIGGAA